MDELNIEAEINSLLGRYNMEPDTKAYLGYRRWATKIKTLSTRYEPVLSPISNDHEFIWKPETIAFCESAGIPVELCDHFTSEENTSCTAGIYCLKDLKEPVDKYLEHRDNDILGETFVYGKVIEGDLGYRATRARVRSFYYPLCGHSSLIAVRKDTKRKYCNNRQNLSYSIQEVVHTRQNQSISAAQSTCH